MNASCIHVLYTWLYIWEQGTIYIWSALQSFCFFFKKKNLFKQYVPLCILSLLIFCEIRYISMVIFRLLC